VGGSGCSTSQVDWFNYALKGDESAKPNSEVCLAMGEQNFEIPAADLLAPQMEANGSGGFDDTAQGYTEANFSALGVPNSALAEATTGLGAIPAPHAAIQLNPDDTHPALALVGIATAEITVSNVLPIPTDTPVVNCDEVQKTLRTGCDAIIYVGLGKSGGLGANWKLIDDQLVPIRGLGTHQVEFVGVAEQLAAGEDLFLLFYGSHIQFFASTSRDVTIPLVNVSGQIKLPLYEGQAGGWSKYAADWNQDEGGIGLPDISPGGGFEPPAACLGTDFAACGAALIESCQAYFGGFGGGPVCDGFGLLLGGSDTFSTCVEDFTSLGYEACQQSMVEACGSSIGLIPLVGEAFCDGAIGGSPPF